MRIASFNVENLFSRARAMNQDDWAEGKPILTEFSKLNVILGKDTYTAVDKTAILTSLENLGVSESDENKFVNLRQNRGQLVKRPASGNVVVANGRGDWIGWLALKTEAVNETATRMTAQVIKDVNADILAVVEAEDRIALTRFNDQLLEPIGSRYSGIMLIDGNDDRGIDVGLLTKGTAAVESIVSHVDDADGDSRIFSRDCPEFTVRISPAETILVVVNHLKSKGYGSPAASNARRKAQAKRVREIYDQRRAAGVNLIAIAGDFNDTPASDPLKPLLGDGSDLKDIFDHPAFVGDGRLGTYANGTASNKIDYLLFSPALFARVTGGGVFRKGVWGGVNGTLFPHYDEMAQASHAASDHAAIWADFN
ncbi:endonuclease exonuclease phosphatase : Putative extracellular nuclease OS=Singulisphaera acidiphila (strain ATCC BAA-1392 / DSM 18658 / VKM B-2454 / MOB10) GN=Sinac_7137 PE=4 SV=1: Exo_endo_phos [Gemmata massiliana]|uniref:Endonuclease/exonuclease/phosphatase domain-containing protein n=1 Tax=Gemmata massiliana TaxID=1210884 RepID=A0A6P2D165_9BACT|nr:endonuclease/exonuclease/phosphatase family protein [Gemmata massiliana]VTR94326.1 endonuclease exonuclease phosphatase : Putative extracellular nuclease OS=Singulisphaera acidiphila (strain ATCC BAA-1392 / DSM 18658 / VKM B-2454 / MOB10) GN=Sinac_7137 PE=4 SV=1: Exo_endo_phos [Gemmata massiliana]